MGECHFCSKEHAKKVCSGCFAATYCNDSCQRSHWEEQHRYTCARIPLEYNVKFVWGADLSKNHTSFTINSSNTIHLISMNSDVFSTLKVNSSLFVQLLAHVSRKKTHDFIGVDGALDCGNLKKLMGEDSFIFLRKGEELSPLLMHYESSVKHKISLHYTSYVSYLLLGPDSRNLFLGMTEQGPMRKTLLQWSHYMNDNFDNLRQDIKKPEHEEDVVKMIDEVIDSGYTKVCLPFDHFPSM